MERQKTTTIVKPMPKRPPGPKGDWLMGSLSALRGDMLDFWMNCARQYGDVVHMRFLHQHHYMLNHPLDIEQMLIHLSPSFIKWRPFRILGPLFGNGLALSEGDYWKRQRRLAQPAFHRQRLEEYAAIMVEHAIRAVNGWQPGEERNIHEDMMLLALDITCSTLFGTDITEDAREAIQHLLAIQNYFEETVMAGVSLPPSVPTPRNLRMWTHVRELDRILYKIIANRRRRTPGNSTDMLSTLLQSQDDEKHGMTDKQVRDEVMTLFVAGYETTALALSWAWYLVARHPQVEARLHEEILATIGNRNPSLADLARLKYAESILKEGLRLYPPVFAQGREAIRECQIGDYSIPKGAQVFISQWVVHRDARFFPDPEAFRPERWQDGSLEKLPRFAYFPFGGGPRVCIGAQFAMMEATLIMAVIASRYRFRPISGQQVKPRAAVTLQPAGGVKLRLEPLTAAAEVSRASI
jgi:cytochrome P450